jgi:hypothetical protein
MQAREIQTENDVFIAISPGKKIAANQQVLDVKALARPLKQRARVFEPQSQE